MNPAGLILDGDRADGAVSAGRTDGRLQSAAELALRLALAGLYLFAAWGKLADPLDFARAVHNYKLLPASLVVPVALALPPWEALAGLGLISGLLYRGAVCSVLLQSGVFAAAVASAMARHLDLSCGCFGHALRSKADLGHIVLNGATFLASAWLLRRALKSAPQRLRPLGPRSRATARI